MGRREAEGWNSSKCLCKGEGNAVRSLVPVICLRGPCSGSSRGRRRVWADNQDGVDHRSGQCAGAGRHGARREHAEDHPEKRRGGGRGESLPMAPGEKDGALREP